MVELEVEAPAAPVPGSDQVDKHCGDIYIPNFYGSGQGVVLDVTVTDAQREVNVHYPKAGGPTLRAERHKHAKYDSMYRRVGINFIP
jgi:hypothetical protein